VTDLDDDEPKKTPRATVIRRALVAALAIACAGGWIYTRYLVKKGTLGEACSYDMHCRAEAPRCLKQSTEGDGVCSRSCETDGDCADKIRCIKVELDDRDDRGRPLEGGYCFPQTLLDGRKKKKPDAGSTSGSGPRLDSWLEVPDVPGQLEGEITIERGAAGHAPASPPASFEVRGSLVRVKGKHGRTILDTSTLRVYTVDDERKTFSAAQLAVSPGDVTIVKTDRKDRVADRECEIWEIEESPAKDLHPSNANARESKVLREACIVKGGSFIDPGARLATAIDKELAVRGVFSLRVSEPDKRDKPRLLVTKLDAHALEPALFAIPKSYKNLAARP
jgi:hypothetical protein